MAGYGKQCIKLLMFIFNFIFFIGGCGILGLGIWLKVEKDDYMELSTFNFVSTSNIAIVVGVVIVLVAFLGCCGAINEVAPMLLAFFILMLIIFILEVAAGALAYSKRNEINDKLAGEFKEAIQVKYSRADSGKNVGLTEAIDKFQEHFECCGFDNVRDWQKSKYYNSTGAIPSSCCKDPNSSECNKTRDPAKLKEIFWQRGCFKQVLAFLKDHLLYVGAMGVALALIQILGLVFSMTLYCSIRNASKGMYA